MKLFLAAYLAKFLDTSSKIILYVYSSLFIRRDKTR